MHLVSHHRPIIIMVGIKYGVPILQLMSWNHPWLKKTLDSFAVGEWFKKKRNSTDTQRRTWRRSVTSEHQEIRITGEGFLPCHGVSEAALFHGGKKIPDNYCCYLKKMGLNKNRTCRICHCSIAKGFHEDLNCWDGCFKMQSMSPKKGVCKNKHGSRCC